MRGCAGNRGILFFLDEDDLDIIAAQADVRHWFVIEMRGMKSKFCLIEKRCLQRVGTCKDRCDAVHQVKITAFFAGAFRISCAVSASWNGRVRFFWNSRRFFLFGLVLVKRKAEKILTEAFLHLVEFSVQADALAELFWSRICGDLPEDIDRFAVIDEIYEADIKREDLIAGLRKNPLSVQELHTVFDGLDRKRGEETVKKTHLIESVFRDIAGRKNGMDIVKDLVDVVFRVFCLRHVYSP